MPIERMTLKPGLMVQLGTKMEGNRDYVTRDKGEQTLEDGTLVSKWEGECTIEDPEEWERGVKVRGKARSLIVGACSHTAFGLLCAKDNESELDRRVAEARAEIAAFNASAQKTRIRLNVLKGEIKQTDEEAARAIASEVADLMGRMRDSIKEADSDEVRKLATRAKQMTEMLGSETQREQVNEAIVAARKAAREITKRVQKQGQDAAEVIRQLSIAPIEKARFAFLDMSDYTPGQVVAETMPSVEVRRSLDVESPQPSSDDEDEDASLGPDFERSFSGPAAAA